MKKLAILLLALSPFLGFSQNESNGFAHVKNAAPETAPTTTKATTNYQTNELPSYFEDDLKLYDGSTVLDMHFGKEENTDTEIMRYHENPKMNYHELEVEFSDDKTVKIQRKRKQLTAFYEKLLVVNNLPQ